MDITSQVIWSSTVPGITTIAAGGTATGVKSGIANITAVLAGNHQSSCSFDRNFVICNIRCTVISG